MEFADWSTKIGSFCAATPGCNESFVKLTVRMLFLKEIFPSLST
ncbi:MAG TPA: hypothetical protein PLE45_10615 [Spirochaetota bacterium]|nr:hypothetical protein [Spirochaetota bacterium]HOL57288.1 hypothetical protein [Spirochaetota bacterium]HPP05188.1 hypothetical protein [Spirochaetota bacterium]